MSLPVVDTPCPVCALRAAHLDAEGKIPSEVIAHLLTALVVGVDGAFAAVRAKDEAALKARFVGLVDARNHVVDLLELNGEPV